MRARMLAWLACPGCGGDLELESPTEADGAISEGTLVCARGHRYPVARGVPRLLDANRADTAAAARSIRESFSREWEHFDYDADRTWGQSVDERREDFLRHIDLPAEALVGKTVLDAGCGNGVLSLAMSSLGCEVVATDLSGSVEAAQRHSDANGGGRAHFAQSDLRNLAVKPGTFDVVYCAGVLHHTPNTKATFDSVVRAVAPGGTMFVWLYWRVPGLRPRLGELLRRLLAPLPAPVKHAAVLLLLPQTIVKNRLRAARGRARRLNARELLVRMLDSYTPRYRWLHTPEELHGWFREHGLTEIATTERGIEGFGVAARRPAAPERV